MVLPAWETRPGARLVVGLLVIGALERPKGQIAARRDVIQPSQLLSCCSRFDIERMPGPAVYRSLMPDAVQLPRPGGKSSQRQFKWL